MIFKQIAEIKAGRKTQTRRIVKQGEWFYFDGATIEGGQHRVYRGETLVPRCVYAVGKSLAIVPKRGQRAIPDGRIRIANIREERLQNITEADARAEGVDSVEAYKTLWESINGKTKGARWGDNPFVWVIEFKYEAAQQ